MTRRLVMLLAVGLAVLLIAPPAMAGLNANNFLPPPAIAGLSAN